MAFKRPYIYKGFKVSKQNASYVWTQSELFTFFSLFLPDSPIHLILILLGCRWSLLFSFSLRASDAVFIFLFRRTCYSPKSIIMFPLLWERKFFSLPSPCFGYRITFFLHFFLSFFFSSAADRKLLSIFFSFAFHFICYREIEQDRKKKDISFSGRRGPFWKTAMKAGTEVKRECVGQAQRKTSEKTEVYGIGDRRKAVHQENWRSWSQKKRVGWGPEKWAEGGAKWMVHMKLFRCASTIMPQ